LNYVQKHPETLMEIVATPKHIDVVDMRISISPDDRNSLNSSFTRNSTYTRRVNSYSKRQGTNVTTMTVKEHWINSKRTSL
jgi:hypothetical protein